MKKRYLVFILALSAALLLSSCAIVGGGTTNQQSRFVKLKFSGSETPMVLNVDQIEYVRYGKTETGEMWSVYLIPAGDRGKEHIYSNDAIIRIYDRENAAILYEAMGMTLD